MEDAEAKHRGGISQGTVELITLTLLPVSVLMIAYALFTFYWRSEFIRRKQVGFFDDKVRAVRVWQGRSGAAAAAAGGVLRLAGGADADGGAAAAGGAMAAAKRAAVSRLPSRMRW